MNSGSEQTNIPSATEPDHDGVFGEAGRPAPALTAAQKQIYEQAEHRYAARFHATTTVEIVATEAKHFGPIANLTLRAYEPVAPTMYDDGYADELTDLAGRADETTMFTALLNGHVVGGVTYVGDSDHELHVFGDKTAAYIRYLAVDPSAQRVGAGRLLAERCIEQAVFDGKPAIGLHTIPAMTAAIALYETLGFERSFDNDGLCHVGYTDPAPAFIKPLP